MRAARTLKLPKILAILALVIQALAPGAMAARAGSETDIRSLICAPSGSLSAEAQDAAKVLLDLINPDDDGSVADGGHCPLCVLGAAAILSEPLSPDAFMVMTTARIVPKRTCQHSVGATGPPLGGRAPPIFL
ncbi:MAG: DUF2946 family protein [Pseudomonadota bacterium]